MEDVPDLDNVEKATLDAGSGMLYVDDRQIVALNTTKLWIPSGVAPAVLLHIAEAGSLSLPYGLPRGLCECWTDKEEP